MPNMPNMPNMINKEKNVLSIGLKEDHVADLIINFLGKKEKLKYNEKKYFTLRLNDIEQFYYLVEEKINKEQYVNIQLFTVSFLFNDKTTRVINTIESLNKYLETRDVVPNVITLTWHIVLQFPNVETIETQKIELTFDTKANIGEILLNIEHTNQSWGIEVLNLIKDKILSVSYCFPKNVKYMNKVKKYVFDVNIMPFYLFLVILPILFPIIIAENYENKGTFFELYKDERISKIEFDDYVYIVENFKKEERVEIIKKHMKKNKEKFFIIDMLKKNIKEENDRYKNMVIILISFILFLLLFHLYIVKYIKHYEKKSYILTTNRAISTYEKDKKRKNKAEFYSISLIIFTIITGLIINYIFSVLNN